MPWQPDYATLAELKSDLRIPLLDTQDDGELAFAITAASRAIDHSTNRQFGQVTPAVTRAYTARFDKSWCRWLIDTDDISVALGVTVQIDTDDDQAFDAPIDSFHLIPTNEPQKGRPFTAIVVNPDSTNIPTRTRNTVGVLASWGWTAVPETITAATIRQAARFFYRREAPFGVAGSPSVGSEIRLLSMVDPDVAVMIRSYRRVWGAA